MASTVCGLLLCCPVTSMAAIVLALAGFRAIHRSGGTLGGVWFARGGLFLGVLGTFVQLGAISTYGSRLGEHLSRSTVAAMNATWEQPPAEVVSMWSNDTLSPTRLTERIGAFTAAATERYGAFRRASIGAAFARSASDSNQWSAPVLVEFERASVAGGVVVRFEFDRLSLFPPVRLERFTLLDASQGDLVVPDSP